MSAQPLARESRVPASLVRVYAGEWSKEVESMVFAPAAVGMGVPLEDAIVLFSPHLPDHALPLALVDKGSIAVVALEPLFSGHSAGLVYRYHLNGVAAGAPAYAS